MTAIVNDDSKNRRRQTNGNVRLFPLSRRRPALAPLTDSRVREFLASLDRRGAPVGSRIVQEVREAINTILADHELVRQNEDAASRRSAVAENDVEDYQPPISLADGVRRFVLTELQDRPRRLIIEFLGIAALLVLLFFVFPLVFWFLNG